jgi:transposase
VEVYARVRRAVQVDGMSVRQASREFGLARKTIRKMLAYLTAKSSLAESSNRLQGLERSQDRDLLARPRDQPSARTPGRLRPIRSILAFQLGGWTDR